MALIFPEVIIGNITHARRGGDDHRQTGALGTSHPGTDHASCAFIQSAVLNYFGSDGNAYSDTLPRGVDARVWTADPTPIDDIDHIGNYAYTLAFGPTTFDQHAKRWKLFCAAMYGGASHLLIASSADFNDAIADLATYIPGQVPANTEGDVLGMHYVNSPSLVRPLEAGCNACAAGIANLTVQLIAGTPPLDLSTPKRPQIPDHVPDDGVAAPTAQIYQPYSLLRDPATKRLYVGCARGVRVIDSAGLIDTVLGTNDPTPGLQGDDFNNDPLQHRVLNAMALRLQTDGVSLVVASDRLSQPGYTIDAHPADTCRVDLHAGLDDATQNPQGLITVTTPGELTALASVQDNYFTRSPWRDIVRGGIYPFSEAFTTGLAITSTGRIIQAYSAIFNLAYEVGDGGISHNFAHLARITDRSATPNVDLLWSYTIVDAISGSTCHADSGFDLRDPQSIWLRDDNTLLIAASGNHAILQMDLTTFAITVLAGTLNTSGFSGDGGPATSAKLGGPQGVCIASDGSIILADTGNSCIRRFKIGGSIATIAGVPTHPGCSQWNAAAHTPLVDTELKLGPAKTTMLSVPRAVYPGPGCAVYIADTGNFRTLLLSCAKSKN